MKMLLNILLLGFLPSVCSFVSKADSRRLRLVENDALFATTTGTTASPARITVPPNQKLWKYDVPSVIVVDDMPSNLPSSLNHSYYLLRHGQSTANVDELISSDRESLAYTNKHSLTALGYTQGRQAAGALLDLLEKFANKGDSIVFCTSPFARARETAQACLDGLVQDHAERSQQFTIHKDLFYHDLWMERSFGRLDNQAIYTYAYVWPLDKMNVTHTAFGVESVAAVCHRIQQAISDIEATTFATKKGTKTHVICVSHADVLQIAQLYAAQVPNVGDFSSYRFGNGEVRPMVIGKGVDSLPPPVPLQAPQRGTGM